MIGALIIYSSMLIIDFVEEKLGEASRTKIIFGSLIKFQE